ncbi:MAG: hypothetical protein PHP23_09275 [Desulfobacterales bacterium]|nr:hypothetical protein [Desulfobacterales bacterium]MDD4073014.1 hypothetical protein [Desulfobacterales bacterium]MDD4391500.1 hypothetical protein [Desulfobacterales bacterium]
MFANSRQASKKSQKDFFVIFCGWYFTEAAGFSLPGQDWIPTGMMQWPMIELIPKL